MAKKKTTTKKKATPKSKLNKTQVIEKALADSPDKGPKEISEALTAKGMDVSPGYVSTIKTNLKAKTGAPKSATKKKVAPKRKAAKAKRTAKKKVAKKKATKKQAPKAAPASSITYEQLKQAKEMAQQLGGIEKAKETLAALSALATD